MNIALIMHELLVEGGGERQCLCLARALMQQGHAITVYTSAYDAANCFPEICEDLKIVETGRGPFPRLRTWQAVRGYLDMVKLAAAVASRHETWNPHHWPAQWAGCW